MRLMPEIQRKTSLKHSCDNLTVGHSLFKKPENRFQFCHHTIFLWRAMMRLCNVLDTDIKLNQ